MLSANQSTAFFKWATLPSNDTILNFQAEIRNLRLLKPLNSKNRRNWTKNKSTNQNAALGFLKSFPFEAFRLACEIFLRWGFFWFLLLPIFLFFLWKIWTEKMFRSNHVTYQLITSSKHDACTPSFYSDQFEPIKESFWPTGQEKLCNFEF